MVVSFNCKLNYRIQWIFFPTFKHASAGVTSYILGIHMIYSYCTSDDIGVMSVTICREKDSLSRNDSGRVYFAVRAVGIICVRVVETTRPVNACLDHANCKVTYFARMWRYYNLDFLGFHHVAKTEKSRTQITDVTIAVKSRRIY